MKMTWKEFFKSSFSCVQASILRVSAVYRHPSGVQTQLIILSQIAWYKSQQQ